MTDLAKTRLERLLEYSCEARGNVALAIWEAKQRERKPNPSDVELNNHLRRLIAGIRRRLNHPDPEAL